MEEGALRACGFSQAKTATILGIAQAARAGTIPSRQEAEALSDEALIARLVALRGVGRWTVEMLLMFTLGRPDILPIDDFGVREGWRVLKGLEARPMPKALAAAGAAWSPYRSTAAWYLWRAADAARGMAPTEATGG
jgi:DNA-3-methyladenine glycosylase II